MNVAVGRKALLLQKLVGSERALLLVKTCQVSAKTNSVTWLR